MYNLFLDDLREPYINPKYKDIINKQSDDDFNLYNFASAYSYSKYEPFKNEEWIIARNYNEFVKIILEKGLSKRVAFDHDLGDEHYPGSEYQKSNKNNINYDNFVEKTGYDCAIWLCNYCMNNELKFPDYYVHSWNKVGAENIIKYVENYKKYVENE